MRLSTLTERTVSGVVEVSPIIYGMCARPKAKQRKTQRSLELEKINYSPDYPPSSAVASHSQLCALVRTVFTPAVTLAESASGVYGAEA